MQAGSERHAKLIAWNGVRITVPALWETMITAGCHLVFEDKFRPLLQLRWNMSRHSPKDLQRIVAAFAGQAERVMPKKGLAVEWLQLEAKFQILACSGDKNGKVTGGVFSCPHCHTIFHFQAFSENQQVDKSIGDCLATLSCHGYQEGLWRIQDFSLSTPPSFSLTDYSFGAGLTRLSFRDHHLTLDTCRLAPADARLNRQSLAEILLTLTAAADLEIQENKELQSCEGVRSPGIAGRILLRMRRCKPFIRANIRLDASHNRLLALVLTGSRPIPDGILPTLAEGYAIV